LLDHLFAAILSVTLQAVEGGMEAYVWLCKACRRIVDAVEIIEDPSPGSGTAKGSGDKVCEDIAMALQIVGKASHVMVRPSPSPRKPFLASQTSQDKTS